jgi:hypothetical protein
MAGILEFELLTRRDRDASTVTMATSTMGWQTWRLLSVLRRLNSANSSSAKVT